jgi:hypothetical protein
VVERTSLSILDTVNEGGSESLPPARDLCSYVITNRWSCRLECDLIRGNSVAMVLLVRWDFSWYGFAGLIRRRSSTLC